MKLRVLGCQGGSAPTRHLPGLLLATSATTSETVNDRDRVQVIGTVGLAFAY